MLECEMLEIFFVIGTYQISKLDTCPKQTQRLLPNRRCEVVCYRFPRSCGEVMDGNSHERANLIKEWQKMWAFN
jgi:hypothetical protein